MSRPNKTAERIVAAFGELIDTKPLCEIAINDIVKKADVSRMAFYRNFRSINDIANKYIELVLFDVEKAVNEPKTPFSMQTYFSLIFKNLSKYGKTIRALYEAGYGELMLKFSNIKLFKTPLKNKYIYLEKYQSDIMAGAFYNLLISWIKNGMKESAEEISAICTKFAANAI